MTHIIYSKRKNTRTLSAIGHSGYAKSGEDIICAAISSHMNTLMAAVPDERMRAAMDENLPGLTVVMNSSLKAEKYLFDSIANGLELLAREYPKFVHFERV